MGEESDMCIKCPECGCDEYTNENSVGEGYRVCADQLVGESDVG